MIYQYHTEFVLDTSVLILSILQQVLALEYMILQLDKKNNLSVSFEILNVGKIVHAFLHYGPCMLYCHS